MRLIDADKLPYVNKVILVDDLDGDIIITIAKKYTSYVNDETPTVKAIPIEFIEEQIAKTTDINSDELDILYAGNLGYLLKLWEKENETN